MDVLEKISVAFEGFAETAMAMRVAGEKAEATAAKYEDLVESCKAVGLPYESYEGIAKTFRAIVEANRAMGIDEIVKTCLFTAEVCR